MNSRELINQTASPAKPKRALPYKRRYDIKQSIIGEINYLYNHRAPREYLPSDKLFEAYLQIINDRIDQRWHRLTESNQEYIRGYRNALDDILWHRMVWLMSVDGNLYTGKEIDALSKLERDMPFASLPDYRSPYSRVDDKLSRHVYADQHGRPLRDKPFTPKVPAAL